MLRSGILQMLRWDLADVINERDFGYLIRNNAFRDMIGHIFFLGKRKKKKRRGGEFMIYH